MAAAEAPKDTSELWNSVFVIAYSSLLVGWLPRYHRPGEKFNNDRAPSLPSPAVLA